MNVFIVSLSVFPLSEREDESNWSWKIKLFFLIYPACFFVNLNSNALSGHVDLENVCRTIITGNLANTVKFVFIE
jgi:hypothetical protein